MRRALLHAHHVLEIDPRHLAVLQAPIVLATLAQHGTRVQVHVLRPHVSQTTTHILTVLALHVLHIQEMLMGEIANAMQALQVRTLMARIALNARQAHTLWRGSKSVLIVLRANTHQQKAREAELPARIVLQTHFRLLEVLQAQLVPVLLTLR